MAASDGAPVQQRRWRIYRIAWVTHVRLQSREKTRTAIHVLDAPDRESALSQAQRQFPMFELEVEPADGG